MAGTPDSVLRITRHKARGIETEHPAVFPVKLAEFATASCEVFVLGPRGAPRRRFTLVELLPFGFGAEQLNAGGASPTSAAPRRRR